MPDNVFKAVKEFIFRSFCFWCAGVTVVLFIVTKFYANFLYCMHTKSIKDILGFEVTCVIGLLAVTIALAALKPSTSREARKLVRSYQFKAIIACFFTLILACVSYIGITIAWGYYENWESYNNWIPLITTGLFIYTLLTSFIAVLAQMRLE